MAEGPRSRPARTPREETPARRTGSADPLLSAAEHYLARRALGSTLIVKHYQMGRTNAGEEIQDYARQLFEAHGDKAIAEAAQKARPLKKRAMSRRQRRGVMLKLF